MAPVGQVSATLGAEHSLEALPGRGHHDPLRQGAHHATPNRPSRRHSRPPRRVSSPDINTDDFCAAVDYLITRDDVNPEAIGIIGICGWGGIALNAAAIDPRIKATLASTSYVMSRVATKGYFDANDTAEARMAARRSLAAQRTNDYVKASYQRAGGVVDPLPADAPQFVADYYDYYKTPRGFHERSGNSTDDWNTTSSLSWLNTDLLQFADEIENAVMVLHGEQAHSRYMARSSGFVPFSRILGPEHLGLRFGPRWSSWCR